MEGAPGRSTVRRGGGARCRSAQRAPLILKMIMLESGLSAPKGSDVLAQHPCSSTAVLSTAGCCRCSARAPELSNLACRLRPASRTVPGCPGDARTCLSSRVRCGASWEVCRNKLGSAKTPPRYLLHDVRDEHSRVLHRFFFLVRLILTARRTWYLARHVH